MENKVIRLHRIFGVLGALSIFVSLPHLEWILIVLEFHLLRELFCLLQARWLTNIK
jgi:hypothetical protein